MLDEIAPHIRLEMPITSTFPAGVFAGGTRAAFAGAISTLVGVAPPSTVLGSLGALQVWTDEVLRIPRRDTFFMWVDWRGISMSGA